MAMEKDKYDETISDSKAESLLKAIRIWEEENKNHAEPPLKRPNISVGKTVVKHLLWLCGFSAVEVAAFFLLTHLKLQTVFVVLALVALGVLFLCVRFKRFCIDFVLLYQKLAPEKVRRSCVYEPSCSAYMLLAIEKHGAFRGFFKGIKRLSRCHHPNGGVDLP